MTNQHIAIDNIHAVLTREVLIPMIMVWNRLEGRPRKRDFQRALRAEIRDPLWMLTKQWQVGEFKGDDAGSPIFAKVHLETTQLDRYKPGAGRVQPFDRDAPLEATVEQRAIPFVGQHILSLDIRLLMGRQWLKLLKSIGLEGISNQYIGKYDIKEPDPESRGDIYISAHSNVSQHFSAVANRAMDGAKLYFYLKSDVTRHAYDDINLPSDKMDDIDSIAAKFVAWYEKLFYQPANETNDAWEPQQLEYQFGVSAPKEGKEKVLLAEEYYHGHLDWYNLDVDPSKEKLTNGESAPQANASENVDLEKAFTYSFIPTTIQFEGMPNTRWWTFEDGKTNFGDVKPDTTDINKLLLIEFGLVYANDWFLSPIQLPVGSMSNIKGLAVTNVFGERTWVEASGSGQDENWQRWAMYNLAVRGNENVRADTTLVILPTVPKIGESKPLEEIYLIRDEASNMVWGIEKTVPLPNGDSKPGREAALQLQSRYQYILEGEIKNGIVVPVVPTYKASIRYQLMTSVPENWIPFLPVHKDNNNREIQLQRASMPRIIPGDPHPPEKIKPRTVLLRCGLDQTPAQPYFLHEEEVPRAGVRVLQTYQRTRWHDGSVFTWLGVRKLTARGEGSSGLAFDQIRPVAKR